jgi:hypothetical protein
VKLVLNHETENVILLIAARPRMRTNKYFLNGERFE